MPYNIFFNSNFKQFLRALSKISGCDPYGPEILRNAYGDE